jgi:hypothetical protein
MKKRALDHFIKDRHYLDWWSLGHFIFGVVVAFILVKLGVVFLPAVLASLCVFIFWEIIEPEIFEHIIRGEFKESRRNQIMDIIYGFLGFLVYWYFI